MHSLLVLFSLLATFELTFGLGIGIPRYAKPTNEVIAVEEGSSMENSRPFMSRYGKLIGARNLRGAPLMDMSTVILPLEQRAMWRDIAANGQKAARSAASVGRYYTKVNPVLYDMLVN